MRRVKCCGHIGPDVPGSRSDSSPTHIPLPFAQMIEHVGQILKADPQNVMALAWSGERQGVWRGGGRGERLSRGGMGDPQNVMALAWSVEQRNEGTEEGKGALSGRECTGMPCRATREREGPVAVLCTQL